MRDGCPFCDYQGPSEVLDLGDVFVIEPLNPVVEGHKLFIPYTHIDLRKGAAVLVPAYFVEAEQVFREAMEYVWINGLDANIIQSTGAAATQSVFHFHVHVVPRVEGDGLKLPWSDQKIRPTASQALMERLSQL